MKLPLVIIEGFPMVAKAWQEASWFGVSQCDKQRKRTKQTNKQISFIDRHLGFDFIFYEL